MENKDIKLTMPEALHKAIEEAAKSQGKSKEDLIVELLKEKFPIDTGMSQEEEDKIRERLKALGYMD